MLIKLQLKDTYEYTIREERLQVSGYLSAVCFDSQNRSHHSRILEVEGAHKWRWLMEAALRYKCLRIDERLIDIPVKNNRPKNKVIELFSSF